MNRRDRDPRDLENDKLHLLRSRLSILGRYATTVGRQVEAKVVVLHFGRAGSTVLGQALASQASIGVVWDGEVFQNLHLDERAMLKLARDPFRFLDWRSRRATDLYGAEIKVNPGGHSDHHWIAAEPEHLIAELASHGYEIVYLRRSNLLRWAISSIAGRQRRSYHSNAPTDGNPRITVPLAGSRWYGPANDLVTYLQRARRRDETVSAAVQQLERHLVLEFAQDIQSDPNIAAEKVFTFLGIDSYEPTTPKLKPTVGLVPLKDLIANYSEVEEHLRKVDLLQYLENG